MTRVARTTADVGLVEFDSAGQLRLVLIRWCHRPTNAVHEEQRRFVGEARFALNLERADALLARRRTEERQAPVTERNRGVFHDRPDANGELAFARATA